MHDLIAQIKDEHWISFVLCALLGYLTGSVSFARLINYFITGDKKIKPLAEAVPHSNEVFESDLISATLVTKNLGAKYGCMTSVADMIKVALPTLLVKITFTGQPYFLVTALFGIIGHNYPVYYRFIGGRGESPLIGGLLVINWFGIIVVNLAATLLGFISGSVLVIRWGGMVLMIFWYWYYFHTIWYVCYIVFANFLFWFSMRKDLARYIELKRKKGLSFTEEDVSEFILMGRKLGRALDKYSIYALVRKIFSSQGTGKT